MPAVDGPTIPTPPEPSRSSGRALVRQITEETGESYVSCLHPRTQDLLFSTWTTEHRGEERIHDAETPEHWTISWEGEAGQADIPCTVTAVGLARLIVTNDVDLTLAVGCDAATWALDETEPYFIPVDLTPCALYDDELGRAPIPPLAEDEVHTLRFEPDEAPRPEPATTSEAILDAVDQLDRATTPTHFFEQRVQQLSRRIQAMEKAHTTLDPSDPDAGWLTRQLKEQRDQLDMSEEALELMEQVQSQREELADTLESLADGLDVQGL